MLGAVVTEGTGTRAQLEFATVAGKTGTSSSWRDAWFMGFTGKLVTGIWVGNDDFTAMGNATGGVIVAPAWKTFMTAALSNVSPGEIADLLGLPTHPVQLADRERLRSLGTATEVATGPGAVDERVLPEATRAVIERLAGALRKAAAAAAPKTGEKAAAGDKKAELPPAGSLPAKVAQSRQPSSAGL
jgi:penicillin-binding protein 1A